MKENLEEIVRKSILLVRTNKIQKLATLYRMPAHELKQKERDELILLSIGMKTAVQKEIFKELEGKVKYLNTLWQLSTEELQPISFVYIDWDEEPNRNETNIDESRRDILGSIKSKLGGFGNRIANNNRQFENDRYEKEKIRAAYEENEKRLNAWCNIIEKNLKENLRKGEC